MRPKSKSSSVTPRNRLRNRSIFGLSFAKHKSIHSEKKLKLTTEKPEQKFIELPSKNSIG